MTGPAGRQRRGCPGDCHALIAIDACKAGKDIYLEKPLTFTIREGQALVKAVRQNNRILGVGSQQRSGQTFIHAINLIRDAKSTTSSGSMPT